jgi:hypothetical protein
MIMRDFLEGYLVLSDTTTDSQKQFSFFLTFFVEVVKTYLQRTNQAFSEVSVTRFINKKQK